MKTFEIRVPYRSKRIRVPVQAGLEVLELEEHAAVSANPGVKSQLVLILHSNNETVMTAKPLAKKRLRRIAGQVHVQLFS